MNTWSRGRLWACCGAGLFAGLVVRSLVLVLPGNSLGRGLEAVADVGFWFLLATAALFAAQALDLHGFHASSAGPLRKRKVLISLVGASVALAFIIGTATGQWLIFTSPESSTVTRFGSLILDSLLGFMEVAAGFMIAFASLSLMDQDPGVAEPTEPDRPRSHA